MPKTSFSGMQSGRISRQGSRGMTHTNQNCIPAPPPKHTRCGQKIISFEHAGRLDYAVKTPVVFALPIARPPSAPNGITWTRAAVDPGKRARL